MQKWLAKGDSTNAMVKIICSENNKSFPIPPTGEMGTYRNYHCMLCYDGSRTYIW
ncbi:MAG: hypothetical protein ACLUR5_03290 [Eubacterium ventriosum]